MEKLSLGTVLLLLTGICIPASGQITFDRLAQATFQVRDLTQARAFYTGMLGISEAFDIKGSNGEVTAAFFRLEANQYIEFRVNPAITADFQFESIAFLTKNLNGLKSQMARLGLKPGATVIGEDGSLHAPLKDPMGNKLDLMQYTKKSLQASHRATPTGDMAPVTTHLLHSGLAEDDSASAFAFYVNKLGFQDFVHGGPTLGEPYWYNMRIPGDSADYIELMVHAADPASRRDHICIEVPDIHTAYAQLISRGMPDHFKPFIAQNHRWIINLRDPYGIRVEIMGEHTDEPLAHPPQ